MKLEDRYDEEGNIITLSSELATKDEVKKELKNHWILEHLGQIYEKKEKGEYGGINIIQFDIFMQDDYTTSTEKSVTVKYHLGFKIFETMNRNCYRFKLSEITDEIR